MEFIGPKPPVLVEHLALVGYRDVEEAKSHGSLLPEDVKAGIYYDVD